MPSRALGILIVGFWLTMMTLFVNTELNPARSRFREVPIEHVIKLIFQHEQPSDLRISLDAQSLGHLGFQPLIEKSTQNRTLEFSGNIRLRRPDAPRQRFSWDGFFIADETLHFQKLRFNFAMQEPEQSRVEFVLSDHQATVVWKGANDRVLGEQTYPFDQKGAEQLLQQLGMDSSILATFTPQKVARPEIKAQQSSFSIHGEKVDTYLVTLQQSGQTLLEAHVSQIGQILAVKTFLGYNLAPDDFTP